MVRYAVLATAVGFDVQSWPSWLGNEYFYWSVGAGETYRNVQLVKSLVLR